MAPKMESSTSTSLYINILILAKLEGSSAQMKEYMKPGIFSKINRPAFEHTMHFLIKAYDPKLCRSLITCWPILERQAQERIFRRDVVTAVKNIASLETGFPLASFSNSFTSSPGGERLENFLFKFSCLALRNVLIRRGQPVVVKPPTEFQPRRCLTIAKSQCYHRGDVFAKKWKYFTDFAEYCDKTARELKETLVSNQRTLNILRAEKSELHLEGFTSAEDILNGEVEAQLYERLSALLDSMQAIKNQEKVILSCGNVVRKVTDDQRAPVVLESEDHLDIATLLSRTADAVESLSARLKPITTPNLHPQLLELSAQLSEITDQMEKNMKSAVDLIAAAGSLAEVAEPNVDSPGRFRQACQLLDDAGHPTPPLEFRPAISNPTWQTISADTESPPITSVADLLGAQKSVGVNGITRPLLGKKTLLSEKFGSTPARPRSEIPVKLASKSVRSLIRNPNETAQKVVTSRFLPPALSTEVSTKPLHPSKVSIAEEGLGIPSKSQLNKEASTQDVLDLAVSLLSPCPSRNTSLREDASVKEGVDLETEKKFANLDFSEGLSDVVERKVSSAEPEKLMTDKKINRRSVLELIERCKNIVPVSEIAESVVSVADEAEPDEWKDSDIDISLGSDLEIECDGNYVNPMKLVLSPGF